MKKIFKIFDYFFIGFSYLISKKIIALGVIILFVSLLKTSLGYKEELLIKEHDMIFEKNNPNINYYNAFEEQNDYDNTSAISNYLSCYQKQIKPEELPDNIINYINSLKILYDENEEHYAFFYQDLFSGFTVAYNETAPIFTASSIKGPAMIYLYEMASQGKIDLNEKLVYNGNFYSDGSGVLKTKEKNTSYTIEELIYYSIHYSDNIAYAMLMNQFNRHDILSFWQNLGTKHIFTNNTIWGITSAYDASIYMKELYRFSKENKEYGVKLIDYFKNAEWKLVTDKDENFNTASKGGWAGTAIHDAAIVFDENPYLLIIMSNTGESNYTYLFKNTSKLVGELHEAYWKHKIELCQEVPRY